MLPGRGCKHCVPTDGRQWMIELGRGRPNRLPLREEKPFVESMLEDKMGEARLARTETSGDVVRGHSRALLREDMPFNGHISGQKWARRASPLQSNMGRKAGAHANMFAGVRTYEETRR